MPSFRNILRRPSFSRRKPRQLDVPEAPDVPEVTDVTGLSEESQMALAIALSWGCFEPLALVAGAAVRAARAARRARKHAAQMRAWKTSAERRWARRQRSSLQFNNNDMR